MGCRVVVFLASGVCPLLDEAKRFVQVSWWEGLVTAQWWVKLGLVPLVGRAVSGSLFIE